MYLPCLRRMLAILGLVGLGLTTMPASLRAQEPFRIQGTVVDATTRQPLPNVSVVLRGSGLGTLTNANGQYTLLARVPPGDYTLQFAVIGRREASQPISLSAAERSIRLDPVALEQSAVQLEEIVVTGTGAPTERRAIGNTVASVSGEVINRSPGASGVDQALQGRITGAVISETSGQPGGGLSIRLRGTSSILGGAEPLIVVDGVIIDNSSDALVSLGANAGRGNAALSNRLADIAPQDIERIEVIKGAAAAALYGSRANAGVIQIFTKRGSQGQPRISLSSTFEMNRTPDTYDLNMFPFAGTADVVFGPAKKVGDPVQRFDIQDEIFRTGLGTDNQVSVAGGGEATSYYLSAGYRSEEGILESSGYEKVNVRGKLTQQLADWLEVTANGAFIDSETAFVPEGEQTFGVLTYVVFQPTSFDPHFDPSVGRFPFTPVLSFNPLDVLENWRAPQDVTRFVGSFESTFRPTDDLTVRYLFGFDDYRQTSKFFRPPFSQSLRDPGLVQNPIRTSRQFNHDLTGNWELRLSPALTLTTNPGFRYSENRVEDTRAAAEGLLPGVTLVEGATQFASQSRNELLTLGGWIQERLGINDRIFITGALNVEAASAFGQDERWQFYPRIGASWVLHDEPFWETGPLNNLVSTLRVRGAYGETGAQPPGFFLGDNFFFGVPFSARPGFVRSTTLGNPDLRPERQREWEGGFELGLFDDRALIEFTYYDQTTTDLILSVPLPPSIGAQRQFQNVGEVVNQGFELGLSTVNVDRPGLSWQSRLSLATNDNEVTQLASESDTLFIPGGGYPNAVIVGQPVGVFYGRGFLRDAQGEIVIDPKTGLGERSNNFMILGDPNPDFTASLSNTLTIARNLEFNVLLDGRFGNDVANFTRRITEFFGTDKVVEEEIRRQIAGEPPLKFTLNARRISNYEEYVEDATFVKLREVALRYSIPEAWSRRLGAGAATLRLASRNLFTWTEYSGLDPEINLFANNTVARGVDFATTPIPRSFVFGIDLNF
jgi:TonB-linked SusC/RagA family outer membrane protein